MKERGLSKDQGADIKEQKAMMKEKLANARKKPDEAKTRHSKALEASRAAKKKR